MSKNVFILEVCWYSVVVVVVVVFDVVFMG